MLRRKFRPFMKSSRRFSRNVVQVNFLRTPRVNKYPRKCPLVIVHGLFDNAQNWLQIGKMLQKKLNRQVVISELRNHGSSPHQSTMSFDEMSGDLERVIGEVTSMVSVKSCFLLGHSLGGKVAIHLAFNKPLLVEKLIVEDIAPISYEYDPHSKVSLLTPILAMESAKWTSNDLKEAKKQVDHHLKSVGMEDPAARKFYLSNLVQGDEKIEWCINLKVLENLVPYLYTFPTNQAHRRYEGPTLFLFGGNSKFFNRGENDIPIIKSFFPDVRVEYMKNCGHYMHLQKPHEFVDIVSSFVGF